MLAERAITKKQINHDIFRIVMPLVAENLLQMSAGLVTTAMIGRLLANDISAQGISLRVFNTFWALFKGIGMGATVVIAMRLGQRLFEKCRRSAEQTYLTLIPLSVLCSLLIALFPGPVLRFFSDDAALVATATGYIRIVICALPFTALMIINTAAFNGHGNTKTPMMIAVLLNLINIALGYVMIYGIGSWDGFGLTGAAITTVIAQASGGLTGLFLLYRRGGYLSEEPKSARFWELDVPCVREIYRTGIPAACENVFWQLAAIVVSKIILLYGSQYFAAYQMGLQAEMMCDVPGMGFVTASNTLAARSIGERADDMYRMYFKQLRMFSFFTGLFSTIMLFGFPGLFMKMLTDKPEICAIGMVYVFMMGIPQIPQSMAKVYNGFLRAAGRPKSPMVISAIGIWGVRVPITFLCGWVLHLDIRFIWLAIALDQCTRFTLAAIQFKRHKVIDAVSNQPAAL